MTTTKDYEAHKDHFGETRYLLGFRYGSEFDNDCRWPSGATEMLSGRIEHTTLEAAQVQAGTFLRLLPVEPDHCWGVNIYRGTWEQETIHDDAYGIIFNATWEEDEHFYCSAERPASGPVKWDVDGE